MVAETIFVIGLNHETAPLSFREKVVFSPNEISPAVSSLKSSLGIEEALILSTCNRTEIYFCSTSSGGVVGWLSRRFTLPQNDLEAHVYSFSGDMVLNHAAKVASGLNSMVLGETQILGQLKEAFRLSQQAAGLGSRLNKLFETVFTIAKEVRTKTEVGAHSVSLASISLKACARIFDDLSSRHVLFIGAGEMIKLFAQHFSGTKFKTLTFSNRTRLAADTLASRFGGTTLAIESLSNSIQDFDIVVSCTASPIPIIGKGAIESALKQRKHKPIALFDLAVPRDIEAAASVLEDVFLFSIDDLGRLVKMGISIRKNATDEAARIIDIGIQEYRNWTSTRTMVPVVKAFRNHGEDIMNNELQQALSALRNGVDAETVLSKFANSLNNRFLDRPCRALNKAAGSDKEQLANALLRLFYLDTTK